MLATAKARIRLAGSAIPALSGSFSAAVGQPIEMPMKFEITGKSSSVWSSDIDAMVLSFPSSCVADPLLLAPAPGMAPAGEPSGQAACGMADLHSPGRFAITLHAQDLLHGLLQATPAAGDSFLPLHLSVVSFMALVASADGQPVTRLVQLGNASVDNSGSWMAEWEPPVTLTLPASACSDPGAHVVVYAVTAQSPHLSGGSATAAAASPTAQPCVSAFAFLALKRSAGHAPDGDFSLCLFSGAPELSPADSKGAPIFQLEPLCDIVSGDTLPLSPSALIPAPLASAFAQHEHLSSVFHFRRHEAEAESEAHSPSPGGSGNTGSTNAKGLQAAMAIVQACTVPSPPPHYLASQSVYCTLDAQAGDTVPMGEVPAGAACYAPPLSVATAQATGVFPVGLKLRVSTSSSSVVATCRAAGAVQLLAAAGLSPFPGRGGHTNAAPLESVSPALLEACASYDADTMAAVQRLLAASASDASLWCLALPASMAPDGVAQRLLATAPAVLQLLSEDTLPYLARSAPGSPSGVHLTSTGALLAVLSARQQAMPHASAGRLMLGQQSLPAAASAPVEWFKRRHRLLGALSKAALHALAAASGGSGGSQLPLAILQPAATNSAGVPVIDSSVLQSLPSAASSALVSQDGGGALLSLALAASTEVVAGILGTGVLYTNGASSSLQAAPWCGHLHSGVVSDISQGICDGELWASSVEHAPGDGCPISPPTAILLQISWRESIDRLWTASMTQGSACSTALVLDACNALSAWGGWVASAGRTATSDGALWGMPCRAWCRHPAAYLQALAGPDAVQGMAAALSTSADPTAWVQSPSGCVMARMHLPRRKTHATSSDSPAHAVPQHALQLTLNVLSGCTEGAGSDCSAEVMQTAFSLLQSDTPLAAAHSAIALLRGLKRLMALCRMACADDAAGQAATPSAAAKKTGKAHLSGNAQVRFAGATEDSELSDDAAANGDSDTEGSLSTPSTTPGHSLPPATAQSLLIHALPAILRTVGQLLPSISALLPAAAVRAAVASLLQDAVCVCAQGAVDAAPSRTAPSTREWKHIPHRELQRRQLSIPSSLRDLSTQATHRVQAEAVARPQPSTAMPATSLPALRELLHLCCDVLPRKEGHVTAVVSHVTPLVPAGAPSGQPWPTQVSMLEGGVILSQDVGLSDDNAAYTLQSLLYGTEMDAAEVLFQPGQEDGPSTGAEAAAVATAHAVNGTHAHMAQAILPVFTCAWAAALQACGSPPAAAPQSGLGALHPLGAMPALPGTKQKPDERRRSAMKLTVAIAQPESASGASEGLALQFLLSALCRAAGCVLHTVACDGKHCAQALLLPLLLIMSGSVVQRSSLVPVLCYTAHCLARRTPHATMSRGPSTKLQEALQLAALDALPSMLSAAHVLLTLVAAAQSAGGVAESAARLSVAWRSWTEEAPNTPMTWLKPVLALHIARAACHSGALDTLPSASGADYSMYVKASASAFSALVSLRTSEQTSPAASMDACAVFAATNFLCVAGGGSAGAAMPVCIPRLSGDAWSATAMTNAASGLATGSSLCSNASGVQLPRIPERAVVALRHAVGVMAGGKPPSAAASQDDSELALAVWCASWQHQWSALLCIVRSAQETLYSQGGGSLCTATPSVLQSALLPGVAKLLEEMLRKFVRVVSDAAEAACGGIGSTLRVRPQDTAAGGSSQSAVAAQLCLALLTACTHRVLDLYVVGASTLAVCTMSGPGGAAWPTLLPISGGDTVHWWLAVSVKGVLALGEAEASISGDLGESATEMTAPAVTRVVMGRAMQWVAAGLGPLAPTLQAAESLEMWAAGTTGDTSECPVPPCTAVWVDAWPVAATLTFIAYITVALGGQAAGEGGEGGLDADSRTGSTTREALSALYDATLILRTQLQAWPPSASSSAADFSEAAASPPSASLPSSASVSPAAAARQMLELAVFVNAECAVAFADLLQRLQGGDGIVQRAGRIKVSPDASWPGIGGYDFDDEEEDVIETLRVWKGGHGDSTCLAASLVAKASVMLQLWQQRQAPHAFGMEFSEHKYAVQLDDGTLVHSNGAHVQGSDADHVQNAVQQVPLAGADAPSDAVLRPLTGHSLKELTAAVPDACSVAFYAAAIAQPGGSAEWEGAGHSNHTGSNKAGQHITRALVSESGEWTWHCCGASTGDKAVRTVGHGLCVLEQCVLDAVAAAEAEGLWDTALQLCSGLQRALRSAGGSLISGAEALWAAGQEGASAYAAGRSPQHGLTEAEHRTAGDLQCKLTHLALVQQRLKHHAAPAALASGSAKSSASKRSTAGVSTGGDNLEPLHYGVLFDGNRFPAGERGRWFVYRLQAHETGGDLLAQLQSLYPMATVLTSSQPIAVAHKGECIGAIGSQGTGEPFGLPSSSAAPPRRAPHGRSRRAPATEAAQAAAADMSVSAQMDMWQRCFGGYSTAPALQAVGGQRPSSEQSSHDDKRPLVWLGAAANGAPGSAALLAQPASSTEGGRLFVLRPGRSAQETADDILPGKDLDTNLIYLVPLIPVKGGSSSEDRCWDTFVGHAPRHSTVAAPWISSHDTARRQSSGPLPPAMPPPPGATAEVSSRSTRRKSGWRRLSDDSERKSDVSKPASSEKTVFSFGAPSVPAAEHRGMVSSAGAARVMLPLFSQGKYRYDPTKDNGVLSVEDSFNTSCDSPVVRIVLRLSPPKADESAPQPAWCGAYWPQEITTALGRVGASTTLAITCTVQLWMQMQGGVSPVGRNPAVCTPPTFALPWITRRAGVACVSLAAVPMADACLERCEWANALLVNRLRWLFASNVISSMDEGVSYNQGGLEQDLPDAYADLVKSVTGYHAADVSTKDAGVFGAGAAGGVRRRGKGPRTDAASDAAKEMLSAPLIGGDKPSTILTRHLALGTPEYLSPVPLQQDASGNSAPVATVLYRSTAINHPSAVATPHGAQAWGAGAASTAGAALPPRQGSVDALTPVMNAARRKSMAVPMSLAEGGISPEAGEVQGRLSRFGPSQGGVQTPKGALSRGASFRQAMGFNTPRTGGAGKAGQVSAAATPVSGGTAWRVPPSPSIRSIVPPPVDTGAAALGTGVTTPAMLRRAFSERPGLTRSASQRDTSAAAGSSRMLLRRMGSDGALLAGEAATGRPRGPSSRNASIRRLLPGGESPQHPPKHGVSFAGSGSDPYASAGGEGLRRGGGFILPGDAEPVRLPPLAPPKAKAPEANSLQELLQRSAGEKARSKSADARVSLQASKDGVVQVDLTALGILGAELPDPLDELGFGAGAPMDEDGWQANGTHALLQGLVAAGLGNTLVSAPVAAAVLVAALHECASLAVDAAAGPRVAQELLNDYHALKEKHAAVVKTALRRAWNRELKERMARGELGSDDEVSQPDFTSHPDMAGAAHWVWPAMRLRRSLRLFLALVTEAVTAHDRVSSMQLWSDTLQPEAGGSDGGPGEGAQAPHAAVHKLGSALLVRGTRQVVLQEALRGLYEGWSLCEGAVSTAADTGAVPRP